MPDPDGGFPQIDASVPNGSRIYGYYLGGKDNYDADRRRAEELESAAQAHGASVRRLARDNRAFIVRAVTWAASTVGLGICQFLDLGCGPVVPGPSVHEAARWGCQGARVVYADIDPVVISHAMALLSGPGLGAVLADAADVPSVLRSDAVRELVKLG